MVNDFTNKNGVDELPVTVVDGQMVITGRYPTNEGFVKFLNVPMNFLGEQPKTIKETPKRSEEQVLINFAMK